MNSVISEETICPVCEAERQLYTIRKRETHKIRGIDITVYATVKVCAEGHEFDTYDDGQATCVALYIIYEHLTGKNIERFTYDQYVVKPRAIKEAG